jgi:hypothetical protein
MKTEKEKFNEQEEERDFFCTVNNPAKPFARLTRFGRIFLRAA